MPSPSSPQTRPTLRRSDRRALIRALAGFGSTQAPGPFHSSPQLTTWRRLQAAGLLDGGSPVPGPSVPRVTDEGLRALGLPASVSTAKEALRTAVHRLLPFRRPRLRWGTSMEDVTTDDPDDDRAPPISWAAHPMAIATISTEAEDLWELRGHDASLGWDAVEAWLDHIGFPMDVSRHAAVRVAIHDPLGECAHIARVGGAWQREPPDGWASLRARGDD